MEQICCPKCGSNQFTTNKKGFSGKKALVGAMLTGGVGLLAGTIGSNKLINTCLKCGNKWGVGEFKKPIRKMGKTESIFFNLFFSLFLLLGIFLFTVLLFCIGFGFFWIVFLLIDLLFLTLLILMIKNSLKGKF
jgi:predicted nucleic-acid-binding Zn-ribbon protein